MMDYLNLLRGEDLVINDKLKVKHPTLEDIKNYGENLYFGFVSLFCTKPYDLMVELDDSGFDYVDLTNYDVFLMLYQTGDYKECMKIFLGDYDFKLYQDKNQQFFLYDEDKDVGIDNIVYEQISKFIKQMNIISDKTEFNPANKGARKFLIKNERRKRKRQKNKNNTENTSHLTNQISALVWGNTSGYNYNNIWNLYAYQFFDGLRRLQKIKDYNNIMNGVYTGNIDSKNLNQEEIHWLSKN